jgi:ribosomal-protein-alanine N-acetyltransferase
MEEQMKDIICNICGKKLKYENDILKEDAVEITKKWGYFSKKDGETHKLCICENCYDELVKNCVVPVAVEETTEFM